MFSFMFSIHRMEKLSKLCNQAGICEFICYYGRYHNFLLCICWVTSVLTCDARIHVNFFFIRQNILRLK